MKWPAYKVPTKVERVRLSIKIYIWFLSWLLDCMRWSVLKGVLTEELLVLLMVPVGQLLLQIFGLGSLRPFWILRTRKEGRGFCSTALNPSILGNLCVTDAQLTTAVKKLKRAKSDGRQLLSDNVINAPSSFFLALTRLFTATLRHGHIPICMWDAILQPIPKVVVRTNLVLLIAEVLLWPHHWVRSWNGVSF